MANGAAAAALGNVAGSSAVDLMRSDGLDRTASPWRRVFGRNCELADHAGERMIPKKPAPGHSRPKDGVASLAYAPGVGTGFRKRSCSIKMLEHFQAKWEPVRRPEMRQLKEI
jgi:hypothetical protein